MPGNRRQDFRPGIERPDLLVFLVTRVTSHPYSYGTFTVTHAQAPTPFLLFQFTQVLPTQADPQQFLDLGRPLIAPRRRL